MILRPLKGGEVELLDVMGTDLDVVNAAKVSTGKLSHSFGEKERKLLSYLWTHKHTSPFEQVIFKFRIRLPIFVMRQLVRYRTARLNELSGRYAELPGDFYVPEQFFFQHENNKQKSGKPCSQDENLAFRSEFTGHSNYCYATYQWALEHGMAREQARFLLPVNFFTECVWQIDLHNLIKFLMQRLASEAQDEIRWYAQAIARFVAAECPETWALLQATLPLGWADKHNVPESHPTPTPIHPDRSPVRYAKYMRDRREEGFHNPLPR